MNVNIYVSTRPGDIKAIRRARNVARKNTGATRNLARKKLLDGKKATEVMVLKVVLARSLAKAGQTLFDFDSHLTRLWTRRSLASRHDLLCDDHAWPAWS
ncbi:MAG TPA: hypothetical protein VFD75_02395 [Pyrinomonadaceae bacterium]|nr:hypothetical protein [Pyrinomonadaceae bacterium]